MSFKLILINPPAGAKTWYAVAGTITSPSLSVLESWQCADSPGSKPYFYVYIYDALGTKVGGASNIGPLTYSEGVIWTYDNQLKSIVVGSVSPSTTSPAPTPTNPTPSLGASQYSNLQLKSVSPASVIAGGTIIINAAFSHSGASEAKYLLASITKNGVVVKGNITNFTVQNDGSSQAYAAAVSVQITSDVAPGAYDIKLDITDGVFYTPVATVTFTAALMVNAPAPSVPTPAVSPSGGSSTMVESQIDSINVVSVSPNVANPNSRVNINCALTHIGAGETISVYAAIGNAHAVWLGGFDEYFAGQVTVNIPAHSSKTTLNFSIPVDLGDMNPGSYDAYCKILGAILPILTSPVLNLCIQVIDTTGVTPTPGSSGPTTPTSPTIPASTGSTGNTGSTPVTNGGVVPTSSAGTGATPAAGTLAGMSSTTWIILAVVAAMALGGGHEKKEERGAVSGQPTGQQRRI